ncbi:MAG: hypothetical protein ACTHW2_02925 [Tissierella sp.]|uniref:hypothetical protein n=1 Tax=Tissierella sp. TaxID=41274 RepID=UPI003F98967E
MDNMDTIKNKIINNRLINILIIIYFLSVFLSMIYDVRVLIWIKRIIAIFGYFMLFIDKKKIKTNLWTLTYLIIMLLSGLIMVIINGNGEFIQIINAVITFGGISILLLNFKLNIKYMWILFIFQILYYFINMIFKIPPDDLFLHQSRNYISIYVIQFLTLLYIAYQDNYKKVGIFPALICFILSVWGLGRGGILISLILLIGMISLYLFEYIKGKKKSKRILTKKNIIIFIMVAIIVSILIVATGVFELIFGRFYDMGLESARTIIWGDYLQKTFSSFSNLLFGFNLEYNRLFTRYDFNLHNSFLSMHAHYGLIFFLLNIFLLSKTFIFYFKTKEYQMLILMIAFFLRAGTDYMFSVHLGDIFLIYFALYSFTIKSNKLFKKKMISK